MSINLETVTSVSGGKSSAYMAIHYPTDRYVFAPVLTDDHACVIQDPSLRAYCQSKVAWFDWSGGGCRELDLTLKNLRKLEQELGKEIEWVAAPFTLDDTINGSIDPAIARCFGGRATETAMLPNSRLRFCTQSHKIYPIAWHIWLTGNGYPCLMHIGYRADEQYRLEKWKCDSIELPARFDLKGQYAGDNRWETVDYRIVDFPMARNGITKNDVRAFWEKKGWKYPEVSNCDFCFFHRASEHKHQAHHNPDRLQWWINMEKKASATFGKHPLNEIINDPQSDLFDADLSQFSCSCTD